MEDILRLKSSKVLKIFSVKDIAIKSLFLLDLLDQLRLNITLVICTYYRVSILARYVRHCGDTSYEDGDDRIRM